MAEINLIIAVGGFIALAVLICLRIPIALSMIIVGVVGSLALGEFRLISGKFYADAYYLFSSHALAVIPLFLLMGQFAYHGGMSSAIFRMTQMILGRGQLGPATIGACGIFSSICGSSVATAAAMSRIALPWMLQNNYSKSFAAGIICAGGTLGTLIPPSVVLVVYAILAEQSIVQLFRAALIPGIIAMLGYILVCLVMARLQGGGMAFVSNEADSKNEQIDGSAFGGDGLSESGSDRGALGGDGVSGSGSSGSYFGGDGLSGGDLDGSSFGRDGIYGRHTKDSKLEIISLISFLIILAVVIGGIYIGFVTPTEGASIGCLLTAAAFWLNHKATEKNHKKNKLSMADGERQASHQRLYTYIENKLRMLFRDRQAYDQLPDRNIDNKLSIADADSQPDLNMENKFNLTDGNSQPDLDMKNKLSMAVKDTAITTGMIYMILLGASFFSSFLALTEFPSILANWIASNTFSPYVILISMLIIYLILGCLMDTLAMLILTLPIFFPIVEVLDFGMSPQDTALWFGVLVLVTVEIGLITPPLGLNIFVITSMHKNISSQDCYKGVFPFLISDLIRIAILISFPFLSLLLIY